MRHTWLAVALLSLAPLCPAQTTQPDGLPSPLPIPTNGKPELPAGELRFVVMADRTSSHRPGVFETAVEKVNLLRPQFVINIGDLIEGNPQDNASIDRQWDEMRGMLGKVEAKFYQVPGNHDVTNPTQLARYRQNIGPDYYHFLKDDALFLVLDTQDWEAGGISKAQVAYVKKALTENANVRWTFVFMHIPVWESRGEVAQKPDGAMMKTWAQLLPLLGDRKYTAFAGHWHSAGYDTVGQNQYFRLATCGGSSSGIPEIGELDHVALVTLTDKGPRIASININGLDDPALALDNKQMRIGHDAVGAVEAQLMPLLSGQGAFTQGQSELVIANSSDRPVQVAGFFRKNPALAPTPLAIDETVPAKATVKIPVQIAATQPTDPASASPLLFEYSRTFDLPNRPTPLVVRDTMNLQPIPSFACPPAASPVTVDGNLADWANASWIDVSKPLIVGGGATDWSGPADGSFRFAVSRDDKFVYIAVDAVDDALVTQPSPGSPTYDGDDIYFSLNARPETDRKGTKPGRDFVGLSLQPGDDATAKLPKGMVGACIKTDKGFAAELAISIASLDQAQKQPWKSLRINIIQRDRDPGQDRSNQAWQLPWYSPKSTAGSGTFVKDSAPLQPMPSFDCPAAAAPVTIDGQLSDWAAAQWIDVSKPRLMNADSKNWSGPADGSYRFAVSHDDRFVYLAADATDDQVTTESTPGSPTYNADEVYFFIDVRPEHQRIGGREGIDYLTLMLRPTDQPLYAPLGAVMPTGAVGACVKTDKGFACELAIPVAYLDRAQGQPWKSLRLNVNMRDRDGIERARLLWQTHWNLPQNVPDSGTFIKQ